MIVSVRVPLYEPRYDDKRMALRTEIPSCRKLNDEG
jgi:hypothetical protein